MGYFLLIFSVLFLDCAEGNFNTANPTYSSAYSYECGRLLPYALRAEIASYKLFVNELQAEIRTKFGAGFYDLYTHFVDKFGARPSGSEVLEAAIDHMINLTIINGINDVTTEDVLVPHWVRGEESLQMLEPRSKKMAILGLGSSVSTPPEGITAEALVVDSFEAFDKLHNSTVNGKIIVFNAPFTEYNDTVLYRTNGASKAAKKGAVAMLVRSVTPFSIYSPHTGAQYYEDGVPEIPAAAITVEDANLLQRLQEECKDPKLVLHLKMSNTCDTKTSRNTIIDYKGKEDPKKMVIVSGHIDSWDVGQGAMDDGGGMFISWVTPVILKMAAVPRPRRTVRAILWTSEEPGLVGAAAYLKRHMHELQNIDFIMESDEGTFKPLGLDVGGSKEARCVIAEVLKMFSETSRMKESDEPGSDISLFVKQGVPGASLLNANDRYFWFHHTEADTMDVQNMKDVVDCATFWATFAYVIADISIDIPRN